MADNDRFPVKLFPTATATDVLFYVVQGPKLDRRGIPTYGTPYNDITPRVEDWPDHKLVFVSPPDRDGKQKWFFAADRQNQDEYNFTTTQVSVGGEQRNAVIRTYITPRSGYNPLVPATGEAMPNVPTGKFPIGYSLFEKRQLAAPDETLASLFVLEEHTYVKFDASQGMSAYEERQVAGVSRKVVPDGTAADEGVLIGSSTVTPLGGGLSVLQTVSVTGWEELLGTDWDEDLMAQIPRAEKYVSPPSLEDLALPNTSFKIVNKDRSLRVTEVIPVDALTKYYVSFPTQIDLALPDELIALDVTWDTSSDIGDFESDWQGYSTGESASLSGSESGQAHSSASIMPQISFNIKQVWGRDLSAVSHFFFLPMPLNSAAIVARVEQLIGEQVSRWPTFQPQGHVLSLIGGKVGVSVNVSASAAASVSPNSSSAEVTRGQGSGIDFQKNMSTVRIPPTLHGNISVGNSSQNLEVSANAKIGWYGSNFPTVFVNKEKTGAIVGSVKGGDLPATTPSSVPRSGVFLVKSQVTPYKWGYAKVYAETFDASQLQ